MQVPQLSLEQQFELQQIKNASLTIRKEEIINMICQAKRLLLIKNKILNDFAV